MRGGQINSYSAQSRVEERASQEYAKRQKEIVLVVRGNHNACTNIPITKTDRLYFSVVVTLLYIYRHLQSVARDLVLVTNVDLLDILSLALVNTDSLHTRSNPDVGVTEQETNLLKGLVLGLREEEV